MSIRTRTSIYVALTMLVLTLVFVFLGAKRVEAGFNQLDQRDATKSVNLVKSWIVSQSDPAKSNAQGWANWTPSYKLNKLQSAKYNRQYDKVNFLPGTLEGMNADFFIFLNNDKDVVYSKFIRHGDLRDEVIATALQEPDLTDFTMDEHLDGRRAIIPSSVGPVAMGSAPTVRDDDPSVPASGTLLTGRFLDSEAVKKSLSEQTGLDAATTAWFSPDQPDVPPSATSAALDVRLSGAGAVVKKVGANQLDGYGVLTSTRGIQTAIVKVRIDPVIGSVRRSLLRDTLIGLLIFIVVSIAALVIALDTSVLKRLSGLINGVREIGAADEKSGVRVPVMGRDEIAELATSVNGMLEAIDKQRDDLVKLATVDALTNVFNRRRFVEELRRELEKSKRLGEGGALLWFDLDHFKEVNDTYGHTTGDHVLIACARLLGSEMRSYCTLARLGGDEFVMMIPGADREQAGQAAERLLEQFEGHTIMVDDHAIKIGVSIGVAFYPEHGDTVEALLESADNAMYDSKREGRGCVTIRPAPTHDEDPPPALTPEPPHNAPGPAEPATT